MKVFKYLAVTLFCIGSLHVSAQDTDAVFYKVTEAIKAADANDLCANFADVVNLTIAEKSGYYSKDQAKQIMKNFFSSNKDHYNFTVKHRGYSKEGSLYCIGTLKTEENTYRVYYLVKKMNNKTVLSQIEFELEKK